MKFFINLPKTNFVYFDNNQYDQKNNYFFLFQYLIHI